MSFVSVKIRNKLFPIIHFLEIYVDWMFVVFLKIYMYFKSMWMDFIPHKIHNHNKLLEKLILFVWLIQFSRLKEIIAHNQAQVIGHLSAKTGFMQTFGLVLHSSGSVTETWKQ